MSIPSSASFWERCLCVCAKSFGEAMDRSSRDRECRREPVEERDRSRSRFPVPQRGPIRTPPFRSRIHDMNVECRGISFLVEELIEEVGITWEVIASPDNRINGYRFFVCAPEYPETIDDARDNAFIQLRRSVTRRYG